MDPGLGGKYVLTRTEKLDDEEAGETAVVLSEDLKKIKISCFDGKQWVTDWNDKKRHPLYLRVEIASAGGEENIFKIIFPIR